MNENDEDDRAFREQKLIDGIDFILAIAGLIGESGTEELIFILERAIPKIKKEIYESNKYSLCWDCRPSLARAILDRSPNN